MRYLLPLMLLLGPACERPAPKSKPAASASPSPSDDCRLDLVGGWEISLKVGGEGAAREATLAALKTRAERLNPTCEPQVEATTEGVKLALYDKKAVSPGALATLTHPGVLWVAPWGDPRPEPPAKVQRPEGAIVLGVERAQALSEPGPGVSLTLDAASAKRFEAFTAANTGRIAVFAVDDRVLSSPRIMQVIKGPKLQISLGGGPAAGGQARMLARTLAEPPLLVPVEVSLTKDIGPAKGAP